MDYKIVNELLPEDLFYLRNLLGWKEIKKDQLEKGLYNTEYKITVKNDIDVIGIARTEDLAKVCVQIFYVRHNKMVGRDKVYLPPFQYPDYPRYLFQSPP